MAIPRAENIPINDKYSTQSEDSSCESEDFDKKKSFLFKLGVQTLKAEQPVHFQFRKQEKPLINTTVIVPGEEKKSVEKKPNIIKKEKEKKKGHCNKKKNSLYSGDAKAIKLDKNDKTWVREEKLKRNKFNLSICDLKTKPKNKKKVRDTGSISTKKRNPKKKEREKKKANKEEKEDDVKENDFDEEMCFLILKERIHEVVKNLKTEAKEKRKTNTTKNPTGSLLDKRDKKLIEQTNEKPAISSMLKSRASSCGSSGLNEREKLKQVINDIITRKIKEEKELTQSMCSTNQSRIATAGSGSADKEEFGSRANFCSGFLKKKIQKDLNNTSAASDVQSYDPKHALDGATVLDRQQ